MTPRRPTIVLSRKRGRRLPVSRLDQFDQAVINYLRVQARGEAHVYIGLGPARNNCPALTTFAGVSLCCKRVYVEGRVQERVKILAVRQILWKEFIYFRPEIFAALAEFAGGFGHLV